MAGLMLASQVAFAQDASQLVGTWQLKSFEVELQGTGEKRSVFGKNPSGFFIFTPDGRAIVLLTGDARKAGDTDQERAALYRTMNAYTGTYRVEGDKLTTKVDVSWNEAWTGTDQVRFFKLDGNRLDIVSAWAPAPNLPDHPTVRGILSWERSK